MTIQELIPFINQHGRLVYINKLGLPNILFGYIREVHEDHITWQDNENPDTFKISNIQSFDIIENYNLK